MNKYINFILLTLFLYVCSNVVANEIEENSSLNSLTIFKNYSDASVNWKNDNHEYYTDKIFSEKVDLFYRNLISDGWDKNSEEIFIELDKKLSSFESNNSTNKVVDNEVETPKKYYIAARSLNVRDAPSIDSKIIKKLKRNDEIFVHETKNGWVRISSNGSNDLWTSKKYISNTKTENTISNAETTKKIKELNAQLALFKSMMYSQVGASGSSTIGAGCKSFSNIILTIMKAENSGVPKNRIPLLISDLDVFQFQRIAPKSSFASGSLSDAKEELVDSFSDFKMGELKEFGNISGGEGLKLLKGLTELICFSGIMSGEW